MHAKMATSRGRDNVNIFFSVVSVKVIRRTFIQNFMIRYSTVLKKKTNEHQNGPKNTPKCPRPPAGRKKMSWSIEHQSNTKNVCKKFHEKKN